MTTTARIRQDFIQVLEVGENPDVKFKVLLKVGVQEFVVGPSDWPTRKEAMWFADRLAEALSRLVMVESIANGKEG